MHSSTSMWVWWQQLDFATCPLACLFFTFYLFLIFFIIKLVFSSCSIIIPNPNVACFFLQVNANELTNGVINAAFMLLFKDAIRLFAAYNEGIINLLGELLSYLSFQNSLWPALHIGFYQLSLLLVPVTETFKLKISTHSSTAA